MGNPDFELDTKAAMVGVAKLRGLLSGNHEMESVRIPSIFKKASVFPAYLKQKKCLKRAADRTCEFDGVIKIIRCCPSCYASIL